MESAQTKKTRDLPYAFHVRKRTGNESYIAGALKFHPVLFICPGDFPLDTLWAKCYQKASFIADIDTSSRAESVHAMISPQLDSASSLLDVVRVVDKSTQRHNFEASFKAFRTTQKSRVCKKECTEAMMMTRINSLPFSISVRVGGLNKAIC
jgi:hypothetical protein